MSKVKNLRRKLKRSAKKCFSRYDRRCRFYDLSKIEPSKRVPRSKIIQFYSSFDNVGNYLPVLGIRKTISIDTDTWCMHDKKVDFDFINRSYKGIIIGGAGLLNKCFQPFWEIIGRECQLPMIVWGIGGCYKDVDKNSVIDKDIANKVFNKCDLIDLRDDITASFYGLSDAHLSPCPTVGYLETLMNKEQERTNILFSSHENLLTESETARIKESIGRFDISFKYTNNIQTFRRGLNDILEKFYCKSRLVITTRLHGAIISYGLHIPYVAIPRDDKIRAFHRMYSNGIIVEDIDDLGNTLKEGIELNKSVRIDLIYEFASKAKEWLNTVS